MCTNIYKGTVIENCDECMGTPPPPPPVCKPTENAQRGTMLTHLGGNAASPDYCLRLDNFKNLGSPVTFECTNVVWEYDGTDVLVIAGTVFGGKDVGSVWDAPQEWTVWARYTGIASGSLTSPSTDVVLVIYDDDEAYTYSGVQRSGSSLDLSLNFRVGSDPRAAYLYTAEGWMSSNDDFSDSGAQDWIGLLECDSNVPPPPPDPRTNWCCACTVSSPSVCIEDLPYNPSGAQCGTYGQLMCSAVEQCQDCLCSSNEECGSGECCTEGSCEPTADKCLKCPDEEGYGNCLEIECNVALPSLTFNGMDILEKLGEHENE